jgi:hypothetical protein
VRSWGLTRKRDGMKRHFMKGGRECRKDSAVVIDILLVLDEPRK